MSVPFIPTMSHSRRRHSASPLLNESWTKDWWVSLTHYLHTKKWPELPPRVELGTTDYKSVILPAKLQKLILNYFRQAFYFQLREIVSNLAPLTAVWVPEDVTFFVVPTGIEPVFYPWKGYVLADRRRDHFWFPICQRPLTFCCYLNNNTKIQHSFLSNK